MIIQGKVWGQTSPIFFKNNVEVHYLEIEKGGYCSKHLHKFKFNKFYVLHGLLKVTIWKNYGDVALEDVTYLNANQEMTVAPGDFHKFEALDDTICLEMYWVELNENDINRLDHGGVINEKKADTSKTPITGINDGIGLSRENLESNQYDSSRIPSKFLPARMPADGENLYQKQERSWKRYFGNNE